MTSNQFLTTPVLFLAGLLTAIVGGGSAAAQEQSDSPYAAYYPLENQTAASVVP